MPDDNLLPTRKPANRGDAPLPRTFTVGPRRTNLDPFPAGRAFPSRPRSVLCAACPARHTRGGYPRPPLRDRGQHPEPGRIWNDMVDTCRAVAVGCRDSTMHYATRRKKQNASGQGRAFAPRRALACRPAPGGPAGVTIGATPASPAHNHGSTGSRNGLVRLRKASSYCQLMPAGYSVAWKG